MTQEIPVLVIGYNRPRLLQGLFEHLKELGIENIWASCDGARTVQDISLVKECHEIIVDNVKDGNYFFSDLNRGCKDGVIWGISRFFENVEYGIILEDDIRPNYSFFKYMISAFEHFKDRTHTVYHLSGSLWPLYFTFNRPVLSEFVHVWGWGTWAYRWHELVSEIQDKDSRPIVNDFSSGYWNVLMQEKIDKIYDKDLDTWDHLWEWLIRHKGGFALLPPKNMVENIGFGKGATHTKSSRASFFEMRRPRTVEFFYFNRVIKGQLLDRSYVIFFRLIRSYNILKSRLYQVYYIIKK